MSYQLMAQTQVSYHLSIIATVQNDNDIRFGIIPLVQLTGLIFLLWQATRLVSSIWFELITVTGDILFLLDSLKMAASIYVTIAGIIGKSVIWGIAL